MRTIKIAAVVALSTLAAVPAAASAAAETVPVLPDQQQVLWVANNWDGTASAIQSSGSFRKLRTINVIPDRRQREREISRNPLRYLFYISNRLFVLRHHQYVDDLYTTADGSNLVISRPSFGDVISIELATGKVAWRFSVGGWRSDHMAVSPDRSRVAVSASLANTVHILDIETGRQVGQFRTGDGPHENYFSRDGSTIYNSSIGIVTGDSDELSQDWTKGRRRLTIADARTFAVRRSADMGRRLQWFGRGEISSATRPFTFTPDETQFYFQSSFHHGYSVYDIAADRVTKVVDLPKTAATPTRRDRYVLDSAHHGIAMSPAGDKLCVAATVSDYATVVDTATDRPAELVPGKKPYWITISGDGRHCVVSWSDEDTVGVLNMDTGREVARIPVGYHPQRIRLGLAPASW